MTRPSKTVLGDEAEGEDEAQIRTAGNGAVDDGETGEGSPPGSADSPMDDDGETRGDAGAEEDTRGEDPGDGTGEDTDEVGTSDQGTPDAGQGSDQDPPANPDRPAIGNWWRLTAAPGQSELGDTYYESVNDQGATRRPEAVDFTIYQDTNGDWHLVSCIRGTQYDGPNDGGDRLFFEWSASSLSQTDWNPQGIFKRADAAFGHDSNKVQAPHVIVDAGVYYMFYNSAGGAFLRTSDDGISWVDERNGSSGKFFQMARDVMIFDNRAPFGVDTGDGFHAFWTEFAGGPNGGFSIARRTSSALMGPWNNDRLIFNVVTPEPPAYKFVYAESPFVFAHRGWYYRLEQMNVIAGKTLYGLFGTGNFEGDGAEILTTLTGNDPQAYLAPEIIHDNGKDYIAAYSYRGGRNGIYMAEITWERQ